MASIGIEVIRIALNDVVRKQIEIEQSMKTEPLDEKFIILLKEQNELIRSTKSLFERVY